MASMTTLFQNGTEVEVGMFGSESVICVSALMGMIQSLNHVYTRSRALDTDAATNGH